MVKALHKAGIEVILDVVFNHTAEGNHDGPTLSFRGLSNEGYYILEHNKAYYRNYSGCGNTFKMSAVGGNLILDCLRYWVSEMHVDGFRFDLASILSRSITGAILEDAPIIWMINSDPVLASTKIIAEAWDSAGLYQVGRFAGDRFAEWNAPYRDDIRRFIKSDAGMVRTIAARLMGSADLYPQLEHELKYSINFVTCHDGLTLNDLVSYNYKHNEANDEDNQDGINENWSWNCGIEGIPAESTVESLRLRQIKNFFTILLMSQGTPMILMGDEVRRSQRGNNNAYCQDSELSWFDWSAVDQNSDLLKFVKGLIKLTQSLKSLTDERHLVNTDHSYSVPYVSWHGIRLGQPDWSEDSHSLAFTLYYPQKGEKLHILLNAYWKPLLFELPPLDKYVHWHQIIDTALLSPRDFREPQTAPQVLTNKYQVKARSSVVLMAQSNSKQNID
jgi:glycogen operon protein